MKKTTFIFLLLLFISASLWAQQKKPLEIHFIDVGFGDAILIKSPSGEFSLIDTGYPKAEEKLRQWLKRHNVLEIKHFIITHPHPDHLGCGVTFLKNFKITHLWDNGQKIDHFDERLTKPMVEEYEKSFRGHPAYKVLQAGDKIQWGEISLTVLWPRDITAEKDWNTNSLVIMLRYQKLKVLLAADFNERGERELLKEEGFDLKADLLKVGHHGAGDATSPEFLQAVSPCWAVISVGENPWGYPSDIVPRRLKESNITVFRTDRDGTIVFRYLPPRDIEIRPDKASSLLTQLK